MNKKHFIITTLFINIIFILSLTACGGTTEDISENGELAKSYLEEMGYKVLTYEGDDEVIFSEAELLFPVNIQFWAVQYTEPDEFLNKRLDKVKFVVKNHPLDDMFEKGKTKVTVYLFNGRVIGGISEPVSKEPMLGGFYSIDGKTAEKIHSNYDEWMNKWVDKYEQQK